MESKLPARIRRDAPFILSEIYEKQHISPLPSTNKITA
jgi:hypothetical protein